MSETGHNVVATCAGSDDDDHEDFTADDSDSDTSSKAGSDSGEAQQFPDGSQNEHDLADSKRQYWSCPINLTQPADSVMLRMQGDMLAEAG